jgi:hypothetical protein
MRSAARSTVVAMMMLAAAVCAGGDEDREVLPSGLGEDIDRAVEQVRAATTSFRSVDRAQAAGYTQETECVEKPPEGAMGFHFTKAELRDGLVELEKPEVLVYEKRANGTFKLNGVEYIVPIDSWKQPEPPTVMGQAMKRFDRGGFWYLHVWIWKHSPSGLFADWNPRVKCLKSPR